MTASVLIIVALIGLFAGTLSGLMGVGGGTIIIPAMVLVLGLSQHLAQAVSLAVIVPTAMIGAYGYYLKKNVDVKTALYLAAGAILGSVFGVYAACLIPSGDLKKVFGFFAIIVAIKIFKDVLSPKK